MLTKKRFKQNLHFFFIRIESMNYTWSFALFPYIKIDEYFFSKSVYLGNNPDRVHSYFLNVVDTPVFCKQKNLQILNLGKTTLQQ